MLKELRPAFVLLVIMAVLTGVVYPLAVTGGALVAFPWQAGGSLIERDGKVAGSALIGQPFADPGYFWGRPSATSAPDPKDPTKTMDAPYNAANSSGSNLGPTSKPLVESVAARVKALRDAHPEAKGPVPADLVTASGSGLDPHISPAAAQWQAHRVAVARRAPVEEVRKLVEQHTAGRVLEILGEPRVNVLALNIALDAKWPIR